MDRRNFLIASGGLALLSAATPLDALASSADALDAAEGRLPRVALFWEDGFPDIDGIGLSKAAILEALNAAQCAVVDVAGLATLDPRKHDVLVTPFGSAFPLEGFDHILAFLKKGGNWINLGGTPLAAPVTRGESGWRADHPSTAFHRKLGITQAMPIETRSLNVKASQLFAPNAKVTAKTVYALYARCTTTKRYPGEDGSDGPRETLVRPLLRLFDEQDISRAAPLVMFDHLLGEYRGSRWIIAAFKGDCDAALLPFLVDIAAAGSTALEARTSFACVLPGEAPVISVRCAAASPVEPGRTRIAASYALRKAGGPILAQGTLAMKKGEGGASGTVAVSAKDIGAAGLYIVSIEAEYRSGIGILAQRELADTGFRVMDEALLAAGAALTHDGTLFQRGGKPYPVTGTTYMASDAHRRFLLEPNPAVWDRDFAQMKRAGVNLVRTGIWTGWSEHTEKDGTVRKEVLRAMDAFLLTAKSHDIPVIFTFFAFLPEYAGCENPYLDPKGVERQKRFVRSFVERYRHVPDIGWDLINEPSFCSPKHLWQCRPNYDAHERKAWHDWLARQHRAADAAALARILADRYRCTPSEALALPTLEDFSDANIFDGRHPQKAADYRFFAQDMFTRWAGDLAAVVRKSNPAQLVTVGQDEGGLADRPSPQFHHSVVDYTCVHTWWSNDDLLWDCLLSKVPGKPVLVEETGVMFYETLDGNAWRSEEEARDLLERKMILSLAADGAGFIEWAWNTNPYMPSDNEAAIGLHRIDGTAKPERDALAACATFFRMHADAMAGRVDPPVLMVIPHSQQFSVRNFAVEATRKCVRVMHARCRVRMSAVSEYAMDRVLAPPKLLVIPSPFTLTQHAFDIVIGFARRGSAVFINGPVHRDEQWRATERMQQLGLALGATRGIRQTESIDVGGKRIDFDFRGEKLQRFEAETVRDAATGNEAPGFFTARRSDGPPIFWSSIPCELSEGDDALAALYRHVLTEAGIAPLFTVVPDTPSLLILPTLFRDRVLYAFVNESSRDASLRLTHRESGETIDVEVKAGSVAMRILDRKP